MVQRVRRENEVHLVLRVTPLTESEESQVTAETREQEAFQAETVATERLAPQELKVGREFSISATSCERLCCAGDKGGSCIDCIPGSKGEKGERGMDGLPGMQVCNG
jgi:hypothetical protein